MCCVFLGRMSVRRNTTSPTSPAPVATPTAAARPLFNLPTSRLQHVLRAGAVQSELSDIGAKMPKMKKGADYAVKKGQQSAQELVGTVQRSWAGAKKPAHWLLLKPSELSKRLSKDYKRAIEKKGWENIKAASDATRVIHAETGANMHAVITINREKVLISVVNSMQGFKEEVSGFKTFGSQVDDTSFSQFTKVTDNLIEDLVKTFKMKFGK